MLGVLQTVAAEAALVLRWLALYALLGLAGLPVAALLFPRFPDRGAALALPVSLAIVGLLAFWVGHLTAGPLSAAVAVGALVAAALLARRWGGRVDLRGYGEAMAVFGVAFGLLVVLRVGDPGVVPSGGEKFLDYGLLESTLRAANLPPEDPWFAGEPVRYYYGSSVLAATLARLSATPPAAAYNLVLSGVYATLVTAVYGLAGAVGARVGQSPRATGVLGAFLVGLGGHLATPARLLLGLVPDPLALTYGDALLAGIRKSPRAALDLVSSPISYTYWEARYVLPDAATLFPLWAFRNGDLNAYMVATPFLVLAAACAFAYYRTPEGASTRRRALLFGVVPAIAGLLATISTWSLPTAVGLAWLAMTVADARPATLLPAPLSRRLEPLAVGPPYASASARVAAEVGRTVLAACLALVVGAIAVVWAAPYLLFHTPMNRGIGFFPPRSPLVPLLLVWGVFLGGFALWVAPSARTRLADTARWVPVAEATGWRRLVGVLVAIAVLGWLAVGADLAALALLGPFVAAGWLLLRSDADVGFETVLLVAGCGILLVVEFAYARVWPFDPAAPRWNTVYKVSMQAWVLLGTGAAVALAPHLSRFLDAVWKGGSLGGRRRLAAVAAASLVLSSAVFPAVVLPGGFAPLVAGADPNTLDGLAYVAEDHPDEAAAIDWLDDRRGQPNMVSAPGREVYTWVNAPATLTGVPTVAGWEHEMGYRGRAAYQRRVRDVRQVYEAPWPTAREVLERYEVALIYLGPNERERYGARNFSRYPGIETAFQQGNVSIYRVDSVAGS